MRLLVAYDGSEFADAALGDLQSAGLPKNTEARVLTVADVFDPPPLPPDATPEFSQIRQHGVARVEEAIEEAQAICERAAKRLRSEFPQWSVTTEVVADSPGWAIIKHAEGLGEDRGRADLIAMGAAGRTAVGRTLFGSVALKVLTNARCSVRIGRIRAHRDPSNALRLIVGVDGSSDASAALRAIGSRSWPKGTECRVVTVIDLQLLATFPGMGTGAIAAPHAPAQFIADQAAEQLRKAGLVCTAVIREGAVAHSIALEADEFKADCIFVGARGLRRLERFLLGSVSSAVAMRSHCSVELVHV